MPKRDLPVPRRNGARARPAIRQTPPTLEPAGNTSSNAEVSLPNPIQFFSSDDSYIANWENHVGQDGTLFYAEYSYHGAPKISASGENALNVMKGDFSRASTRRSSKKTNASSKLSRLIGKADPKKDEPHRSGQSHGAGETSKVTFSEGTQGEVKEVEMFINPENRFKYGRRATASESMMGKR